MDTVGRCDPSINHCLKLIGHDDSVVKGCASPAYLPIFERVFGGQVPQDFDDFQLFVCAGNLCNGSGKSKLMLTFTVGLLTVLKILF
ncbi:hypothetical protein L596_023711 [Steinernema carpocapsae]|uniref:Uncharacterized protein n=1 Tax=Steinernema carpocapsae TaxID=34508 RepID=A0A4U5MEH2_STECR|nr:hypothetical protein L596_023711 [Steinernema carpocapsae]